MLYIPDEYRPALRGGELHPADIRIMFLNMRAEYRRNIESYLVKVANSEKFKAHISDFTWDVIDLTHLAENADARIDDGKSWHIIEKQIELNFEGAEADMDEAVCMINTLQGLNRFIKDMGWDSSES